MSQFIKVETKWGNQILAVDTITRIVSDRDYTRIEFRDGACLDNVTETPDEIFAKLNGEG